MPPTSTPVCITTLQPTPTTILTRTHNFNQFTDTLTFYSHHNTKLSQHKPSSKIASLENLPYLDPENSQELSQLQNWKEEGEKVNCKKRREGTLWEEE